MPGARIRSLTSSRVRAKATVIQWAINSLMKLSNLSQAVVSIKFTAYHPTAHVRRGFEPVSAKSQPVSDLPFPKFRVLKIH
jgi:hypothetical protein